MNRKNYIILVLILIIISTICLTSVLLSKRNDNKEISMDFLNEKVFKQTIEDNKTISTEEIKFGNGKLTKSIKIVSKNDEIDDVTQEQTYNYILNKNEIYIQIHDLTYGYIYKNDCIYDIQNENIKYCIEKDA